MLDKIIAAILTIGAMMDFEKNVNKDVKMLLVFSQLEYRAELWVICYKTMLKYMRTK